MVNLCRSSAMPEVFTVEAQSTNYNATVTQTASEKESEVIKVTKFRLLWNYRMCLLSGLIVGIGSLASGNVIGYASPAIPNINSQPNPFHLTLEEHSWFVSCMYLAGMVGAMLSGSLMDQLGRKLGLMVCTLPMVIAWTILASAPNITMFFIGRILLGVAKLPLVGTVIVYNAEVATPDIRGIMISFHEIYYNVGIVTCYVIGSVLPWNWMAIACAAIITVWTCMVSAVPETPRWLLSNKRREEAENTLRWLRRGSNVDINQEMDEILRGIRQKVTVTPWLDYLKPPLLKPLLISGSAFVIQESCGINVIRLYTVSIFKSVGTDLDPHHQAIAVGIIMTIGSCICTVIVDKFERRTLLIASGLLVGFSMTAFGCFFKLKSVYPLFASDYLFWLPLLALIGCTLGYAIGFGPIPYIIVSELFPTRARGRASGICLVIQSLFGFLTTKFFVNIKIYLSDYGAFWVFASVCLLGIIVFAFTIPRTKGRSLENTQFEEDVINSDNN